MFGLPLPPREYVGGGRNVVTEISGRDRPLFFKRPVVPQISTSGSLEQQSAFVPLKAHGVVPYSKFQTQGGGLSPTAVAAGTGSPPKKKAASAMIMMSSSMDTSVAVASETADATQRTVSCQTDYRENEMQTDPYTPDYYVEDGKNPEMLAVMTLTWGDGLPAGLAEVEMIDRVRRRKKVELSLPQGNDDASMQERLVQLEALEQIEWNEREEHIKRLQSERLKHTAEALALRETKREEASAERIERVKQEKMEQMAHKKAQFTAKRHKLTRMLEATYANPTEKAERRDIITDHSKHGNRGKPVESTSLVEKMTTTNYDVRPTLLGFPEGVQDLERTEAPRIERIRKQDMQPPADIIFENLTTNYKKRQAKQVIEDLEFANQTILKSKQGPAVTTSVQDLYRATPRLIRPDTPTLVLEGDEEEAKEEALVLLQRLLRGRSVQNDFFEGKERCRGLIEELQAAQKAKDSEHKYKALMEQEETQAVQARLTEGVIDSIQGDIVYSTMDYLAKELIRQREAAKFEALRLQAETTRQQREDAEKLRRAAEEALRAREDLQFRQLQQVNDYTIHTFLSGLIQSCVDRSAYVTALEEQLELVEKENAEESSKSPEDEICDLMLQFVIPQVERERTKTKSERAATERAVAQAAHFAVQDAFGTVLAHLQGQSSESN